MPTGILVCHHRQLGKQRLPPKLFFFNIQHDKFKTKKTHRLVIAFDLSGDFFQNEMNPSGWCDALCEGKAERRCFLVVFFRQEAKDKFTHAQEVDNLGDTKQRCDDQGSTVGSLKEG